MTARRYLIAAVGVLGLTTAAPASMITLSDVSSELGIDPALLSASMEFSIAGNILTLTVTNNTADPSGFNINELYFNAPDDVTLSYNDDVAGWMMATVLAWLGIVTGVRAFLEVRRAAAEDLRMGREDTED